MNIKVFHNKSIFEVELLYPQQFCIIKGIGKTDLVLLICYLLRDQG